MLYFPYILNKVDPTPLPRIRIKIILILSTGDQDFLCLQDLQSAFCAAFYSFVDGKTKEKGSHSPIFIYLHQHLNLELETSQTKQKNFRNNKKK